MKKKEKVIICKKCGTEIHGENDDEQFTKKEVRTFKAIEKIMIKHPDWTFEECYKELNAKRFYWAFLKYVQKHKISFNNGAYFK